MHKFEVFFKFFLIFVIYPVVVHGECELRSGGDPPLLIRSLGSRKVIKNYSSAFSLTLTPGETVRAFCSSSLIALSVGYLYRKIFAEEDNINSVTISCNSTGLNIEEYENPSYSINTMDISCSSQSMKLYESNETLSNCKPYMSYGIGIKSLKNNALTTGICYDLDSPTIKYAKYFTYRQNNNLLPTKHNFTENFIVNLDTALENFNSLISFVREDSVLNSYREKKSKNILLENQDFEFSSLVQDEEFRKNLNDFQKMFNIIWWRNLLKGNWNYFTEALRERTENVTYMAYTGVSGTLQTPAFQNCKENEIFELNVDGQYIKASTFIYTYLQSLEPDIEEDFVVIAYNTPFYSTDKGTEFCKDMCSEIDWLNKTRFGKTHLMPVFGVMICCRPEEVFNKLENFPYDDKNTIVTSTQISV